LLLFLTARAKIPGPKLQTPVIEKTLTPVWTQGNEFAFALGSGGEQLFFEVKDKDLLGSDFEGQCAVNVAAECTTPYIRVKKSFALVDKKGVADKARGTLLLELWTTISTNNSDGKERFLAGKHYAATDKALAERLYRKAAKAGLGRCHVGAASTRAGRI
jgi:hypothetical protein